MTKDQKHALYIAGGVAAVVALWYFMQRGQIAQAPAVEANPYVPNYIDYNVPPLTSVPGLPPRAVAQPGSLGCGCESGNDGCFTANLESGQNPVSMAQAMQIYRSQDPATYDQLVNQLGVYKISL